MNNQTKHEVSTDVSGLTEYQQNQIDFAINRIWTMPEFKAKHFVGNAQISPYAELKQYYIELSSREDMVENHEYECKKLAIELEIQVDLLNKMDDPLQKKLQQLEVEKYERGLKRKRYGLEAAKKERELFLNLIEKFNNGPHGKLPDGRLLSEALQTDPGIEEVLEKEHWTLRLAKQTAMDMIAYGRAGVGNMDAVSMLGKEQQEEVMAIACDYFVRNEIRTQTLLSNANERIQLGHTGDKLAQQLELDIKVNPHVHSIQSS
jgi:hypothetical protein